MQEGDAIALVLLDILEAEAVQLRPLVHDAIDWVIGSVTVYELLSLDILEVDAVQLRAPVQDAPDWLAGVVTEYTGLVIVSVTGILVVWMVVVMPLLQSLQGTMYV